MDKQIKILSQRWRFMDESSGGYEYLYNMSSNFHPIVVKISVSLDQSGGLTDRPAGRMTDRQIDIAISRAIYLLLFIFAGTTHN